MDKDLLNVPQLFACQIHGWKVLQCLSTSVKCLTTSIPRTGTAQNLLRPHFVVVFIVAKATVCAAPHIGIFSCT